MNFNLTIVILLATLGNSTMKSDNFFPEIYLAAIEEFVRVDKAECPYIFIYSNPSIDSVINNHKIKDRQIICIKREEEIFKYAEEARVILEIEPIKFEEDTIIVKINHHLFIRMEYPYDLDSLPLQLSQSEKSNLEESLRRAKDAFGENKTFSWLNQNAWTYVKFEGKKLAKGFTFISIKTIKD